MATNREHAEAFLYYLRKAEVLRAKPDPNDEPYKEYNDEPYKEYHADKQ